MYFYSMSFYKRGEKERSNVSRKDAVCQPCWVVVSVEIILSHSQEGEEVRGAQG